METRVDFNCPVQMSDLLPKDEEKIEAKETDGVISERPREESRTNFVVAGNRGKFIRQKALRAFMLRTRRATEEKSPGTTPERLAKGGGPITTSVV